MKRRRFIRSTLGLGFLTLPGLEVLGSTGHKASQEMKATTLADDSADFQNIISRGDILRNHSPVATDPWVVLYQGNGRLGSCFGPWGLHVSPDKKTDLPMHGLTRFTHIKHFVRGKFNADYLLPVGTIYWETEPKTVTEYSQHQSFFDGTIITKFTTADYAITITSWTDIVQKDLAGFLIDVKGNCPPVIISTPRKLAAMYDQQLDIAVNEKLEKDLWQAALHCLNTHSTLKVKSNGKMERMAEGVRIHLASGRTTIQLAVNADISVSAVQSLQQTKTGWHALWKKSGWLDLPDEDAQKIWVRSLAYTLYSHNDDGFGCSPPTGLSGNGWPFPFPFDSGCRHLLLLMTGQTDTARKWIEYWHSQFDGLKEYTQRLFKSDGIFLPHVFPYGRANDYHFPDVPNRYYYPVYNSALMVRLADHTAIMVNDAQWTDTYAKPLISEASKFYLHHLKKGDDGLWHLHIIPSISLDESGDINKPDYVSGLISAQYSLQKAIEYGLDVDGLMHTILTEGLAYKSLLAPNGLYYNHAGLSEEAFSKQKHPDQLFAIVHTPLGKSLDDPHRRAYELRYEIASGANTPRFLGHTLGEFILTSARMHNAAAWNKDWSMLLPAKYMDPDLIQFYESTGNTLSFYVTTHGLFAQALLETTVSTWWDQLDLGSCIPWKGTVRFGNIRTLAGVTVNGEITNGTGQAVLEAWKDTSFIYRGQSIVLKRGEKKTVKIESI
jgi:hypothetical protein